MHSLRLLGLISSATDPKLNHAHLRARGHRDHPEPVEADYVQALKEVSMAEGKEASVSDASAEEKALLLLKAAELGRADIINETCATLTEGSGALFHAHVTHVTPGCRKSTSQARLPLGCTLASLPSHRRARPLGSGRPELLHTPPRSCGWGESGRGESATESRCSATRHRPESAPGQVSVPGETFNPAEAARRCRQSSGAELCFCASVLLNLT